MMIAAFVSTIILIIGGLNWALIGIFDWNIITAMFGYAMFARILYVLVGLAAIYMIYFLIMQSLKPENTKNNRSSRNKKSTTEA